jgi:tetratricopeptide (TPR) repeat protein
MHHSSTISAPEEVLASSPSAPPLQATAGDEELIRRLRVEADASVDASRRARLLAEMAEVEERTGDDSGAARDYLAAYEADPSFREPLEGVARLLARRSSLKGLGRFFFDALVGAAATPDERVRALLMHATHFAEVTGEPAAAESTAHQATAVEGAQAAEQASAWLMLEVFAGHTGNDAARQEALAQRARYAGDPTWRGLLMADRARAMALAGDVDGAASLLERARALESQASWEVVTLLETVLRERPGMLGTHEARARAEQHAVALESMAALVQAAIVDGARGDALGVPRWARQLGRSVDAWLRAAEERRELGQLEGAASALNRALFLVDRMNGADARLAEAAVSHARIRLAEQTGDTALAASLAARRLTTETDGALAAALALRVAEHAAAEGDARGALDALGRAIVHDPGSLPARALQLDMLAEGDPTAFAAQLESFADHLATDDARARAFLLAAYVWGAQGHDVASAKAALSQAGMFGASPEATARLGRLLASLEADSSWYEESSKRLLAAVGDESESVSLQLELVRLRWARGDREGADRALRDLAESTPAAWLGRVVEAFARPAAPDGADALARSRSALEELAAAETDPDRAALVAMVAAMRAQEAGDADKARAHLARVAELSPDDALVVSYRTDLLRTAGDRAGAARAALAAAAATADGELAASLRLEAALDLWRLGERKAAIEAMEGATGGAPDAARVALACASWGVDPDSHDARRRALQETESVGAGDPRVFALERFANELAAGDIHAAVGDLAALDTAPAGSLNLAGALGRLLLPAGEVTPASLSDALSRLGARGPQGRLLAAIEQGRIARDAGEIEALAIAAHAAFEAGGGLPSALEWLGATTALGDMRQQIHALSAAAGCLSGDAREALLASAALMRMRVDLDARAPLVPGRSAAARLANLELAPPGCDPRRRAAVLEDLDGLLGEDAAIDATLLAGWAHFAAADIDAARRTFAAIAQARPNALAAWEGVRACAERSGDPAGRAAAAAELGSRCADPQRGAAFWEEAALIWLELGDDPSADHALEASFSRDASRPVAFDRLFRRVRDRRDNEKLLDLIRARLEVTDEPNEIQKLFWEQARVLRESGDQDGALKALEHVTMLDPDHVGALALLGEINIRRGHFEQAADALSRLALLDGAPAKNRATAGVAAVDLYENKLQKPLRALEVLRALHAAQLSTLPVRERLAKVAARTGAWEVATATLEELMNERPDRAGRIEAARLAMVIHRDRLKHPQGAATAVAKLLGEEPGDPEAVDLLLRIEHPPEVLRRLLDGARAALVTALRETPSDANGVHLLAAVAAALGDSTLRQAALGALATLGAADPDAEHLFAQLAANKPRVPQVAIPKAMMRAILAPGDDGPIADLFALLGPTLSEALGPNLQASGVGRRDRVDPRSGLALRNEIASWAGALGLQEFELYVGGKDPLGVQGIPGEPPALVVGPGVNAPLAPLTRARVARELLTVLRGTAVTRYRDEITMAAIVAAACRIADVPLEHPPYAVLAEVERLIGKAMARKTRRVLPDVCAQIASQKADPRAWSRRALASQDRIATIAAGDPRLVLADALGVPVERLGATASTTPRAEDLLRFVLSPTYLEIRRSLGLEGGT